MKSSSLTGYAYLSIAAAVITIVLKYAAYVLTGSVGLLSDAVESVVNLVAAVVALAMLRLAEKPPDDEHMYGHGKAEYFSSVIEGTMILVAAAAIIWVAVGKIIHPSVVIADPVGISVSVLASVINGLVAWRLITAGKQHRSITLEADGKHLMTDVWTSAGVLIGIALVFLTGITLLDPLVAILVGVNIVISGIQLIYRSAMGFMDQAIPASERQKINSILEKHCTAKIRYHGLRTRMSGRRHFISFHVLVPGKWTVQQGHRLLEIIEADIRDAIPKSTVTTHIEPLNDPRSWKDITLDR